AARDRIASGLTRPGAMGFGWLDDGAARSGHRSRARRRSHDRFGGRGGPPMQHGTGNAGVTDEAPTPEASRRRRAALMAAACYLGIALWVMRAVFPSPSTLLPYAAYLQKAPGFPIFRMDQLIDNAVMVRNARLLPTAPHRLFEGYCFPAPRAVTVAPH